MDIWNKVLFLFITILWYFYYYVIYYLFIFGNMNSSLNKSNLHSEIITIKLVVIHTIQIMDAESLDSTQNNSNLIFLNLQIWIHFEIWISIPSVDLSQNSTLEFNFNHSYCLKQKFQIFHNFKCMQFKFSICNRALKCYYFLGHYTLSPL
jgi:hypothetical protein